MFHIKKIDSKEVWEGFLSRVSFYPFFQSWNFGEVQKKTGKNVERFGLFENSTLVSVFSIAEVEARRGHYLQLRHGPVVLDFNEKHFKEILSYLKKLAEEKKASFVRMSPLLEVNSSSSLMVHSEKEVQISHSSTMNDELSTSNSLWFKTHGFISAPIHNMDAENCLVLNLEKTEEQMLKGMRKTHRYLIRKAQTMNIKIIRSKKISDLKIFSDLYRDLSQRKGFVPHSDIKEEFEIFSRDDQVLLLLAQFEGKVISGAFIVFSGDMAIYHHGASLDEYKHIPTSYLLQWEAILEAKKRGKKLYNFWGIAPDNCPNHPWKGLTLFKTGFGGEKRIFLHAQDLPVDFMYWKTYLIEIYTKWRKGY